MQTRSAVLALCLGSLLCSLAPPSASAFYDPSTQRWINRDPVGETGGLNVSCFVHNCPPSSIDPFGLRVIVLGPFRCGTCFYTCVQLAGPPSIAFNTMTLTWQCTYGYSCSERGWWCTGLFATGTTLSVSVTPPLAGMPYPIPVTPPPGVACPAAGPPAPSGSY